MQIIYAHPQGSGWAILSWCWTPGNCHSGAGSHSIDFVSRRAHELRISNGPGVASSAFKVQVFEEGGCSFICISRKKQTMDECPFSNDSMGWESKSAQRVMSNGPVARSWIQHQDHISTFLELFWLAHEVGGTPAAQTRIVRSKKCICCFQRSKLPSYIWKHLIYWFVCPQDVCNEKNFACAVRQSPRWSWMCMRSFLMSGSWLFWAVDMILLSSSKITSQNLSQWPNWHYRYTIKITYREQAPFNHRSIAIAKF